MQILIFVSFIAALTFVGLLVRGFRENPDFFLIFALQVVVAAATAWIMSLVLPSWLIVLAVPISSLLACALHRPLYFLERRRDVRADR